MSTVSLTTRLALLFSASAVIVLLVLGWVVQHAVQNHFVEMDQHEIEGKLSLVRNLMTRARDAEALAAVPRQLENALVGHHHLAVTVYLADGSLWFSSGASAFSDAQLNSTERWLQWQSGKQSYRGLLAQIDSPVGPTFNVAIAQDISHHEAFMREFRRTLAIVTALAAALTALLGWGAARAGLRPLRRVATLAAQIEASRLDQRLPAAQVPAEIEALATAFNAMLARLENSFRRLSDFASDIAHELRTPVSNLMTQTQVALTSKDATPAHRSSEQYREILYSNLEEFERMAQMIRDMLFLAQADNGLLKPSAVEVDLGQEVRALFDYFDVWAEERGITLALEDMRDPRPLGVHGDRLMLRRALSNLLANAIRHTPPENTIWVRLKSESRSIQVSIENPGADIAPEHWPHLFDRFYRVDPARQRDAEEGAGLGLAIVKSIVEAHGGEVDLLSAEGCTRFQMRLPAERTSAIQPENPTASREDH